MKGPQKAVVTILLLLVAGVAAGVWTYVTTTRRETRDAAERERVLLWSEALQSYYGTNHQLAKVQFEGCLDILAKESSVAEKPVEAKRIRFWTLLAHVYLSRLALLNSNYLAFESHYQKAASLSEEFGVKIETTNSLWEILKPYESRRLIQTPFSPSSVPPKPPGVRNAQ